MSATQFPITQKVTPTPNAAPRQGMRTPVEEKVDDTFSRTSGTAEARSMLLQAPSNHGGMRSTSPTVPAPCVSELGQNATALADQLMCRMEKAIDGFYWGEDDARAITKRIAHEVAKSLVGAMPPLAVIQTLCTLTADMSPQAAREAWSALKSCRQQVGVADLATLQKAFLPALALLARRMSAGDDNVTNEPLWYARLDAARLGRSQPWEYASFLLLLSAIPPSAGGVRDDFEALLTAGLNSWTSWQTWHDTSHDAFRSDNWQDALNAYLQHLARTLEDETRDPKGLKPNLCG